MAADNGDSAAGEGGASRTLAVPRRSALRARSAGAPGPAEHGERRPVLPLPRLQVTDQEVDREEVAAALAILAEHDLRPAPHADRREPLAAQPQAVARDRVREHALVPGAPELVGREQ